MLLPAPIPARSCFLYELLLIPQAHLAYCTEAEAEVRYSAEAEAGGTPELFILKS